jgi:non-homologous end joining protein Ku
VQRAQVIDLMDALKESLAKRAAAGADTKKPAAKAPSKSRPVAPVAEKKASSAKK